MVGGLTLRRVDATVCRRRPGTSTQARVRAALQGTE